MTGFASQAALRSKWGDLVESGSQSSAEAQADASHGLKNVVGWLKQASIEVREAGKRAVNHATMHNRDEQGGAVIEHGTATEGLASVTESSKNAHLSELASPNGGARDQKITILHYNDVYNIEESSQQEPVGGAARFCTAIKSFKSIDPLVIFSGDAFSPSMISTYTKGEQMIPVLNSVGTDVAVFGNHDFDHGLDVLAQWIEKTKFPWLMSNVVDGETGRPLGGGRITHIINHWTGLNIGFIGLVEKEWLDTLPTIDPKEVTYLDFVKVGNELTKQLRNEGCDFVIALTHMRTPNDIELASKCPSIDLILGGHDHVFEVRDINGTKIIKSGTDFRQFSCITIDTNRNENGKLNVHVKEVNVTKCYEEDEELKKELFKYTSQIEDKKKFVLGTIGVELDGRFSSIRTSETNLGSWVCDVILSATGADVVMINAGTFRSDVIHPPGPFTMEDLTNLVPMWDPLIVLEMTGSILYQALENSVSSYPKLEGRFPQVSGVQFFFDPTAPPNNRVEKRLIRIGDKSLNMDQIYTVCIKSYMHSGRDGYAMFKDCPVIMDDDCCPELGLAMQNHFKAVEVRTGKAKHSKHRQSLVPLSRRHSLLDNQDFDGPSPIRRISLNNQKHPEVSTNCAKLLRRASLEDLEQVSCQLSPTVQNRIVIIKDKEQLEQLLRQREMKDSNTIIQEDENES